MSVQRSVVAVLPVLLPLAGPGWSKRFAGTAATVGRTHDAEWDNGVEGDRLVVGIAHGEFDTADACAASKSRLSARCD